MPVPGSGMPVRTVIFSQPAVGTASSEAKQPTGTSETLEVLHVEREVAWHDVARLEGDDRKEPKHCHAAVLDLRPARQGRARDERAVVDRTGTCRLPSEAASR